MWPISLKNFRYKVISTEVLSISLSPNVSTKFSKLKRSKTNFGALILEVVETTQIKGGWWIPKFIFLNISFYHNSSLP